MVKLGNKEKDWTERFFIKQSDKYGLSEDIKCRVDKQSNMCCCNIKILKLIRQLGILILNFVVFSFSEPTSRIQESQLLRDVEKCWVSKNVAKSWIHLSIGNIAGGVPTYFAIDILRMAIGRPPPLGLGIGTVLWEGANWWKDGSGNISGCLPLTIYLVPYANWNKRGLPLPLVYSYFSINNWLSWTNTSGCAFNNSPANYLKSGFGISFISIGFESGFIFWKEDFQGSYKSVFFFGGCMSLGLWKGFM
ncbi:MAG: hypothetical protein ABIL02_07365 [candidate division WOR-3 bacterium]